MGMGMTDWVGGAMSGTGSAMQFMAQGKRERAQNRVAGQMRAEATRFGQEKFEVSDTLRKALDSIAVKHGENTSDYIARRNSPDRQLLAEQEQDQRVAASQVGLNKALAAVNGPPGAYRGVDSVVSPGQAVMSQGGVPSGSNLDRSMAIYGQREQPMLQGILAQLANQGFLQGGAHFDSRNQQQLALTQRPLDNEAMLRQLLTGLRQGESQLNNQQVMTGLNQDMEHANKVGSNEMLWGSILQNIGSGVSGSNSFSYQSANGGSPAEASGHAYENSDYVPNYGPADNGMSMPYENADYVPDYNSLQSPGFAAGGRMQPMGPNQELN